ncbi:hypothetical protein vseg_011476 [Gypsophila vaccaria]
MEASFSSLYSNNIIDPLILMDERANSSDNSGDNSPSTTNFTTSISSPKRSRRAIQKKIVNIPIKDLEGSKFKSECTPPSDSWAWRKYGQKPIKGSPYPRGYYRCSSSKGCPARKQVERSRSDPTMLVVTYSYDHNHPWPTSRNHHHHNRATTATTTTDTDTTQKTINQTIQFPQQQNNNNSTTIVVPTIDHLITNQPLVPPAADELPWVTLSEQDILQNDFIFNNTNYNFSDLDMAKFFPMREEDESLFADLGELPECPVVFRRATGDEPVNLAPWCGSTG